MLFQGNFDRRKLAAASRIDFPDDLSTRIFPFLKKIQLKYQEEAIVLINYDQLHIAIGL